MKMCLWLINNFAFYLSKTIWPDKSICIMNFYHGIIQDCLSIIDMLCCHGLVYLIYEDK